MKHLFAKLKTISPIYLISAGIFLFGTILLGIIFLYQPQSPEGTALVDISDEETNEESCEYVRPIDGVCVADESQIDPHLVAVMIENHYDARPVSGLSNAAVVYEAPVEGNFNRFLAIYPSYTDVKKVGPVRSARPYFLDWVSEYPGAMYMHVGGSPAALEQIQAYDLFDMNEMYRGWYFWRDQNRYIPHNVYTSQELWGKAFSDYAVDRPEGTGRDLSLRNSWSFDIVDACTEDCVEKITTVFSGDTYSATWKYNTSSEQYERYEFGKAVIDPETDSQIVADTLIVQYVDTTVLDSVGRLGMDTIGSGDAIVFRNGFKVEGEWRKNSRERRTRFYDFDGIDGNEIPLKAGKIWIVVMNGTGSVEIGDQ